MTDGDQSEMESIRAAATAFRDGLEALASANLPGLRNFPRGSCGDASRLLAEYLKRLGLGEWGIVTAWRDSPTESHAWLVRDDLLLDITADQFGDVEQRVILTSDSPWHQAWNAEPTRWNRVGIEYYASDSGARSDLAGIIRSIEES